MFVCLDSCEILKIVAPDLKYLRAYLKNIDKYCGSFGVIPIGIKRFLRFPQRTLEALYRIGAMLQVNLNRKLISRKT